MGGVVSAGGPLLVLDGVHLQSSLAVHLSTPPSLPSSSPSSSSSSPASAVLRYALRVQNLGEAEAAGGGDGGNGLMPVVSLVVRRFDWKAVLGVQGKAHTRLCADGLLTSHCLLD